MGNDTLKEMLFLSGKERAGQVKWLKTLAVVDRERLYALAGFDSLFSYVNRGLGYSEGSVGKRIQCCRAAESFPLLYDLLAQSALSLSVISRLSPHLTKENHQALLARARGMSVRQVEELIAALAPQPEVAASIRRVSGTGSGSGPETQTPLREMAPAPVVPPKPSSSPKSKPKEKIKPLSEARYHVNFTIGQATSDLYQRLKEVSRHSPQAPSLEDLLTAGLRVWLEKLAPEKRLALKRKPQPQGTTEGKPSKNPNCVSREIRRAVFARDGYQCVYVSADGVRCLAKSSLEVDHIRPRALGGSSTDLSNLRVYCSCHNRFAARQVFGDSFVDKKIAERKRPETRHT